MAARTEAALRPGFPLLADPSGSAYAAFGLGRGGLAQLFGPAVIARAIGAALRGHLPGAPSGDVLRMPGAFVVGPDGRIRLAHYARHVGDHAPVDLLLRSLPPPTAGTSP